MLSAIRKRTGSIVVKLLLGLLVLSFGAWGIGDYITGNVSGVAAATVGEREISVRKAANEMQRELNRLRQYMGDDATFETARAFGLDVQVLRRLVQAQLYSLAAQSHGIVISDDDVRRRIQSMPAFRGLTGSFDRATFRQTIANAGYSENGFIELIRDEMKQGFVLGSLNSGAMAPDTLVEQVYAYRHETRAAQFTTILDAGFDDIAIPDGGQVLAFHQENQDQFMAPEYRDVTYIHLRGADLADIMEVSDQDLAEAYEYREAEFVTQARRNVEQAIFSTEDQAHAALSRIADGLTFAAAAKELTGATADSLALGWITPEQLMGTDAADAVFAAVPGELAGPVKSMLGWHVFNIVDGEDETRQTLDDVADTLRRDVAMERALDDLFELANQMEDLLGSGSTLEEAAAALNVSVPTVTAIDRSGADMAGITLTGLPGQGFLQAVFATEEGAESPLVESGNDSYFIVRINGVTSPALRPLDSIRDDVIAAIMAAERQKTGKAAADAIAAKLTTYVGLDELSFAFGDTVITGDSFKRDGSGLPDGIPPQMAAALFDKNIGEGAVVRRTDGFVIGHVTDVSAAPLDHTNNAFTALKAELGQGMRGDLIDQFSMALELRYPVTINPDALLNTQGVY